MHPPKSFLSESFSACLGPQRLCGISGLPWAVNGTTPIHVCVFTGPSRHVSACLLFSSKEASHWISTHSNSVWHHLDLTSLSTSHFQIRSRSELLGWGWGECWGYLLQLSMAVIHIWWINDSVLVSGRSWPRRTAVGTCEQTLVGHPGGISGGGGQGLCWWRKWNPTPGAPHPLLKGS